MARLEVLVAAAPNAQRKIAGEVVEERLGSLEAALVKAVQEQQVAVSALASSHAPVVDKLATLELKVAELDKSLAEVRTQVQVAPVFSDLSSMIDARVCDAEASLHSFVDKQLAALKKELDMRETLLRCAEELSTIGELMVRYESRLVCLEKQDSGDASEHGKHVVAHYSKDSVWLAPTSVGLLVPGALRQGTDMPFKSRKVRFQDADSSDESTRTSSPVPVC